VIGAVLRLTLPARIVCSHGGDSCSEYLRKNLHIHCAEGLWTNNTHEKLPASLIKTFEDVEDGPTSRHAPGSCCCTVIIKGRKVRSTPLPRCGTVLACDAQHAAAVPLALLFPGLCF